VILRALFFQNNEELGKKGILGQAPSLVARFIWLHGRIFLICLYFDGKISVFALVEDLFVHTAVGKNEERNGKGRDVRGRNIERGNFLQRFLAYRRCIPGASIAPSHHASFLSGCGRKKCRVTYDNKATRQS
jgi:hypothetical protein